MLRDLQDRAAAQSFYRQLLLKSKAASPERAQAAERAMLLQLQAQRTQNRVSNSYGCCPSLGEEAYKGEGLTKLVTTALIIGAIWLGITMGQRAERKYSRG